MSGQQTGRINIALTGPADLAKDAILARFPFPEKTQAIRLGLAYAIRRQLAPVRGDNFGHPGDGQNMNVGSFDPTGEIRALIQALYPDADDPYQVAETLMSLGLVALGQEVTEKRVQRLRDILEAPDEGGQVLQLT